jgi:L-2-hydroxyglutarate oxidase LhgO
MACYRAFSRSFSGYQGSYDVLIVGGGIVGLATGKEIAARFPDKKIAIVEKETNIGKIN